MTSENQFLLIHGGSAFRKTQLISTSFIKSQKQKYYSFVVFRNLCVQMNKVKTCLAFIFFKAYICIILRYNLASIQKSMVPHVDVFTLPSACSRERFLLSFPASFHLRDFAQICIKMSFFSSLLSSLILLYTITICFENRFSI